MGQIWWQTNQTKAKIQVMGFWNKPQRCNIENPEEAPIYQRKSEIRLKSIGRVTKCPDLTVFASLNYHPPAVDYLAVVVERYLYFLQQVASSLQTFVWWHLSIDHSATEDPV